MNGKSPSSTVQQAPNPSPSPLANGSSLLVPTGGQPPRVLQIAFVCHPKQSMETRIGWRRAIQAATAGCEVTVLHGGMEHTELLEQEAERLGLAERLRFVAIERCGLGKFLSRWATTYYMGYRLWHGCALKEARRLHAEEPFDLVHQTTYCGFREPGYGWRLGIPFVWGPIGGTQSFPTAYLGQMSPREAWIELCRNAINAWQLRFSPRVRRATKHADVLVAATRRAAKDLGPLYGREVPVMLETGLEGPVSEPRPPRQANDPLRIMWAGRLRAWKTMPLLLKALPLLPPDVDWQLRVLGVGSSETQWRSLATRLGVADRIEWVGWPEYRETLPHYRWADAFAFTSMRDTSGTGLLESLSAGTPIVGVDHQGAADIMTTDCAVPAPVGNPKDTIRGFATALTRLARDPDEWHRLSEGARRRAQNLHWDDQSDELVGWYRSALETGRSTAGSRQVRPTNTTQYTSTPPAGFPPQTHPTAG